MPRGRKPKQVFTLAQVARAAAEHKVSHEKLYERVFKSGQDLDVAVADLKKARAIAVARGHLRSARARLERLGEHAHDEVTPQPRPKREKPSRPLWELPATATRNDDGLRTWAIHVGEASMTVPEYARACGIPASGLYLSLRAGELPHKIVQGLRKRMEAEAVDEERADIAKRLRLAQLVIG